MQVYTEIMEKDHYEHGAVWDEILLRLNEGSGHSDAKLENLSATVDVVPDGDGAIFKGIIKPN